MAKPINPSYRQLIVTLKSDDFTFAFAKKYFARTYNRKTEKYNEPILDWTDTINLKANECLNKTAISTTVGRIIFNKFIIQPRFKHLFDFINEPITKGKLKDIEFILSKALLDDKITSDDMADYLDRIQWLGLTLHTMVCGSFTPKTIEPLKKVMEKKNKLLKENADAIKNGDIFVTSKIEKELLDDAKKELAGDEGMDLFDSGARGSFNNNYKNIMIMRGAAYNPIEGKYDILTNGFIEGLNKSDIPSYGTQVTNGAYPKAEGTKVAGYETKKYFSIYQDVVLGPKGSDCGSKKTLAVKITKKNYSSFLYRYIVINGRLVMITEENAHNFFDKTVQMRSPMYCTSKELCNKCAGDLYYKLDIKNIGLTTSSIGSHFLNLLMKSFHDATVKVSEIDINNIMM